jgi:hypothetical protein
MVFIGMVSSKLDSFKAVERPVEFPPEIQILLEDIDGREQPELARINSFSVNYIVRFTCEYFNLKNPNAIVLRKGADWSARRTAMYLAVRYRKRTDSLANIASYFGVGINGISSNTKRCGKELLINKAFHKQLQEFDELLRKNTKAKVLYPNFSIFGD